MIFLCKHFFKVAAHLVRHQFLAPLRQCKGGRSLFSSRHAITSALFVLVLLASYCPVQTGSPLPPVENIHQLGDPPQWDPLEIVSRSLGLTPKFPVPFHQIVHNCISRDAVKPHIPLFFGGKVGLFHHRDYFLLERGVYVLVEVVYSPPLLMDFICVGWCSCWVAFPML